VEAHLAALPVDGPPFAVANNGPLDTGILQHGGADLAGEGAVSLVGDVLRRDLDVFPSLLRRQMEVDGRGSDDDLCTDFFSPGSHGK